MVKRMTVQSKFARSVTTNPLEERINPYQSNCYTSRPATLILVSQLGRALTVGEIGALSDLDNVTVRIADVATYLAVLGDRRRDELRASTFP